MRVRKSGGWKDDVSGRFDSGAVAKGTWNMNEMYNSTCTLEWVGATRCGTVSVSMSDGASVGSPEHLDLRCDDPAVGAVLHN